MMKNNWQLWPHDEPEAGMLCCGLYSDGGGAFLFYVDDDGVMRETQGDEIFPEWFDENIVNWCELPNGFKFWEWRE